MLEVQGILIRGKYQDNYRFYTVRAFFAYFIPIMVWFYHLPAGNICNEQTGCVRTNHITNLHSFFLFNLCNAGKGLMDLQLHTGLLRDYDKEY